MASSWATAKQGTILRLKQGAGFPRYAAVIGAGSQSGRLRMILEPQTGPASAAALDEHVVDDADVWRWPLSLRTSRALDSQSARGRRSPRPGAFPDPVHP